MRLQRKELLSGIADKKYNTPLQQYIKQNSEAKCGCKRRALTLIGWHF